MLIKFFKIKKKQFGFTLAEVLVSLTVIGVVAAMTIPSLMQKTQDEELKAAWKKSYAEIANATNQLAQENGGNIKGLCVDNDNNCFRDLFITYLKYTKMCNSGQTFGKCWHTAGKFWYLDGTETSDWAGGSGLILNNGNLVRFWHTSQDCNDTQFNIPRCGSITYDINGFKAPNRFGKDIFAVNITTNGLKPFGIQEDSYYDKCENSTGNRSGMGCAAKYLYK